MDVRHEADPLRAAERAISERDLSGAVARLVVQMTPEQEPRLRDANLAPLLAGAFFAQINRDVERTTRDRLDGLEPDAMTPLHLLERYLQSKGKPDAEIAPYLAEAQTIFAEDVEA